MHRLNPMDLPFFVLYFRFMKPALTLTLILCTQLSFAQGVQIIAPPQPLVSGTAFQVQYIAPLANYSHVAQPVFDSCKVISGPHYYTGVSRLNGKDQPVINIAYTLMASSPGAVRLGSITVHYTHGEDLSSEALPMRVIAPAKASFTTRSSFTDARLYSPRTSAESRQMIRENLFVKADVNKRTVYAGEPLVASFKVYSRLQSASTAERSPSFYGFSVVDMANINEAHVAVEERNGKVFNTSLLRQVQLFPVRSGLLQIDPMYVHHEIEFQDSITHSNPHVEQDETTPVINIQVKPLPSPVPEKFSGAVGQFSLHARMQEEVIEQGQIARLTLVIRGAGNFVQFAAPEIQWLPGIDPLDPESRDSLSRSSLPMAGQRIYTLPFVVNRTGTFNLPPLTFVYFDLSRARYDSIVLQLPSFEVKAAQTQKKSGPEKRSTGSYWWILPLIIVAGTISWLLRKKKSQSAPALPAKATTSLHAHYYSRTGQLPVEEQTLKQTALQLQKILHEVLREQQQVFSAEERMEGHALAEECQMLAYAPGIDEGERFRLKEKVVAYLGTTLKRHSAYL